MRPATGGPWRKTLRAESKGQARGRRSREAVTQPPRPGSTWWRRHWWSLPRPDNDLETTDER